MNNISDAALDDLKLRMPCHEVAGKWVKLRKSGAAWIGPCPLCSRDPNKKTATKFKATEARWMCAVCMDGGDVIELVRKVEGKDFSGAIEWLGGVQQIEQAEAERRKNERNAKAAQNEAAAAEFRERERGTLYEVWKRGVPATSSTVDRYLAMRGLNGAPTQALRCIEAMPYYESGRKDAAIIHRGPAMLAAFVRGGKFSGLHITWLDARQPNGKLKLEAIEGEDWPAKKMRGSKSGALIALVLPAPEVAVTRVFIGEGIETTLSVWCALSAVGRLRDGDAFYAAGDLGNLAGKARESVPHPHSKNDVGRARRVPGPWPDETPGISLPASCTEVVILGDGDSDGFTTRCALARAATRFADGGREVVVALAPEGSDFNDVWRSNRDAAAVCRLIDAAVPLAPEDVPVFPPESSFSRDHRDPLKGYKNTVNGNGRSPPIDGPDERQRNLRLAHFPLTDLGNAERFSERYRDRLLWCSALGWLVWDEKRWSSKGADEVVKLAEHDTVRMIQEEAKAVRASGRKDIAEAPRGARDWMVDEKKGLLFSDKIAAWGRTSEAVNKLGALSKRGAPYFAVSIDRLDTDKMKINVNNGTLVVRRSTEGDCIQFRPHDPADRITKLSPIDYKPKAQCAAYDSFLNRVQPDSAMRAFIHQWFGLSLTGDVSEQKLAFLYGKGSNGKSVLVDVVSYIAGDYGETVPIETFLDHGKSRNAGQATPDLAILPAVRMLRTSEPEKNSKIAEATIKLVTGGEPILARHLNRDFFKFYPEFKLTISGNYRPTISGADEGIWRRVRLVPFNVTIPEEERDLNLSEKLRAEASGILNRLLDGLRHWCDKGLVQPDAVTTATAEYRSESDPLGRFLEMCVIQSPGERVQSSVLYSVFEAWCKSAGETVWKQKGFSMAMAERGYKKMQSNGVRFLDIKLIRDVADFVDERGQAIRISDGNRDEAYEDDEVPI